MGGFLYTIIGIIIVTIAIIIILEMDRTLTTHWVFWVGVVIVVLVFVGVPAGVIRLARDL